MARHVELAVATVDLTLSQYRVLGTLGDGREAASGLAQKLAVSRPSVTGVVDGLVARGLVRRDPGAVRSLVGRTYTVTRPGHVKERRVLTDAEFAAALTDEFALKLTPDEIATLVAAPTVAPASA